MSTEKPTQETHPIQKENMEDSVKVMMEIIPEMATAYVCIKNGENNILSLEVLEQLKTCIDYLSRDTETKFAVFHSGRIVEHDGTSPKITSESAECSGYFSTGANIREMSELSQEASGEYSKMGQDIMKSIQSLNQKTIAVIPKGFCVGGGLELAMSCNYRIANEGSVFQMPEKKLGIIPGWRGTQNLPYHVGAKEAEDLINKETRIRAKTAYELGLIDYIVENPLGATNSMIINHDDFISRSKHSPEKITLDGVIIDNDETEQQQSTASWNNGVPAGMTRFLEERRKTR